MVVAAAVGAHCLGRRRQLVWLSVWLHVAVAEGEQGAWGKVLLNNECIRLIHISHLDSFYTKFDRSPLLVLSFGPNSLAFAQDYADWSCTTSQQYPYFYARQK